MSINKIIIGTVIGAIVLIAISSIVIIHYYENEENITANDSIQISEKPTISENVNNTNYQNAQMIVNFVIEKYDQNNQEIESIKDYLGFNINSANKKYVFVYDMESKNIVAHPNSDLLGKNVFEDLITTNESVTQIDSELINNGESIMTYDWINPDTSTEEIKTSYLKLQDGLVFGSGYFEK